MANMPVHVFGNPCDVEMIEKIASKHKLKVIYVAAHAVLTTWKGRSVLEYGDIFGDELVQRQSFIQTGEGWVNQLKGLIENK